VVNGFSCFAIIAISGKTFKTFNWSFSDRIEKNPERQANFQMVSVRTVKMVREFTDISQKCRES